MTNGFTQGAPRRRALCAAGLVAALAACAPTPDGVEPADIAAYEAAVYSLDCTIKTERDYRTVEFQAGLTRAQSVAISSYELGAERAVRPEAGGIRLVDGPCAPGATPIALVELPKNVRFTRN